MNLQEYLKTYIKRYDDEHYIHYFKAKDFINLHEEKKSFISKKGYKIMTFLYYYDNFSNDKLVIFVHGLGGGHLSYLREIEYLCKKGFLVLSFDLTGCFESEGISNLSLTQAICDLDDVLNFVKLEDKFKNKEIICIGHSLGGFAVNNIYSLHQEISKIISISGITTIDNLTKDYLSKDKEDILKYERDVNLKYALLNPIDSYNHKQLKALIIHSQDDNIISFSNHAMYLYNGIKNDQVEFYFVNNKLHNPNYSLNAVKYMTTSFSQYFSLLNEGKLTSLKEKIDYFNTLDFVLMTEQDEEIMNLIVSFIKK